jgi:uncharacterized protein YbjT (DUF2867 family)
MLAIIGASGKIGSATLDAIFSHGMLPADQIIGCTSSEPGSPKWSKLSEKGVQVRHASFDDPISIKNAISGCDKLFLISSPRIFMDFFDAPQGHGREKDHFAAINAACDAGIKHIYYTSLAFISPSKSNVMTAHERTEAYLKGVKRSKGVDYTIIREGLYNESWPLYFGHFNPKTDSRTEVIVAGDGAISWTSISDLGLANAVILVSDNEKYKGNTLYLSNTRDPKSLADIASMLSSTRKQPISLKVVSRSEHEEYYIKERGMNEGQIKWWAKTYDALKGGECRIEHDKTLELILSEYGRVPKPVQVTVDEMIDIN